MKRYLKRILAVLLVLCTLGLTSCAMSRANVYNYWKTQSGTEYLGKDHIVEKVKLSKLDKLVQKQGENDILYVFFGDHSKSTCQSAIKIYNEQAIQYGISTLYWVESYNISDKDKSKFEKQLGISTLDYTPALYVFKNKTIVFDSSRAFYKNNSSKYTAIKLAQIAFKNLYDENGEYVEK